MTLTISAAIVVSRESSRSKKPSVEKKFHPAKELPGMWVNTGYASIQKPHKVFQLLGFSKIL